MTRQAVRMSRAGRMNQRWDDVRRMGRTAGMSTAEYAVGTLAAVAFAAVLIAVVKSGMVKSALTSIIQQALSVAS